MDGSIRLSAHERNVLLQEVRRGTDPERRLRAHILVLLNDGFDWNTILAVLFTSTSTINRWRQRYLAGGLSAVLESKCSRRPRWHWVIALVIQWVTVKSPRDFGFYRSRWTCGTVVALLKEDYGVRTSRETVRCWLHDEGLVWRRPRPVLGPKDPQRSQKLRKLRALLRDLPANEAAFFQDEVDVNTNPKIGSMWMWRGKQADVVTPGTNTKRYLAGSIDLLIKELRLPNLPPDRVADLVERLKRISKTQEGRKQIMWKLSPVDSINVFQESAPEQIRRSILARFPQVTPQMLRPRMNLYAPYPVPVTAQVP